MFIISAIQSLTYILIGNTILGIWGMYWDYWLVLFATSCFANMLGLNISSAFNSVVTIYILIPILLIPQILLSGVIVKFDKLNPLLASQTVVPWSGEVMTSRWSFEALAVNQFKHNKFHEQFYVYEKLKSIATYKKNYWVTELKKRLEACKVHHDNPEQKELVENSYKVLIHEMRKEVKKEPILKLEFDLFSEKADTFSIENEPKLDEYLDYFKTYYNKMYNVSADNKEQILGDIQAKGKDEFLELKNDYENENLSDLVTNSNAVNRVIEFDGQLIQKMDPIYKDGEGFRAHFFAPTKKLFGKSVDTYWVNILVIWMMTIFLFVTLYFDILKRAIDGLGELQIANLMKKAKD